MDMVCQGFPSAKMSLMTREPYQATLEEVARTAGVHLSTASRVLHSSESEARRAASSATAERIRSVAAALNYQRDPTAARLRTGRSMEIAVIVPRLADLVLATMYDGIQDGALDLGYTTYVSNSHDDPELREQLTERALARRVDGLIYGDANLDPTYLRGLRNNGHQLVLVNRRSGDLPFATCDDTLGGKLVADHFLALGHRRVAVVGGHEWASTSFDRSSGFRNRMAELGHPVSDDMVIQNGFQAEMGYAATAELLQRSQPPTAVFAVNDFNAIGAMGAVRAQGLSIGIDVAVAGFNDTPLASVLPIPLTSVRSPMLKIGRAAVEMLVAILNGDQPNSVAFEPQLIPRESTVPGARLGPGLRIHE